MQRGIALVAVVALTVAGSMSTGVRARDLDQRPAAAPVPGASACPIFPATNVWNADISHLPVAANSAAMIQSIGLTTGLHPDFGSDTAYGIPYNVVGGTQAKVPVTFDYADESDTGPYPIPANPQIEGGSDAHVLIVDKDACVLYELWDTRQSGGHWSAGSGAIWNLRSNALRPDGWTSADAAGLPILPGLVRYDEIAAGVIDHALRFTAVHSRNAHIYPARHDAGQNNAAYPPMGLRVRLKTSVDISGFSPQVQVVLAAMQKYGMILADNGSNWYVSGTSDPRFNDDDFHRLNQITGADFDVVDTSALVNGPDQTTSTPTAAATLTQVPPTVTPTRTLVPPTASPTRTSVPATASPTQTSVPATASPTRTPLLPTASPTPTSSPPAASATRTAAVPTATWTQARPTLTATRTATARPSATGTAVRPTPTATRRTPRTVVLAPVADAYVRDGQYAATNFGTSTSLVVKYAPGQDYNRRAYLRFDLRGVSGTVTAASLRLFGQHVATGAWSGTESVYAVGSGAWTEGGITWQTQPAAGQSALASIRVGENRQYYSWNLGAAALSSRTASGLAGFVVIMNTAHADN